MKVSAHRLVTKTHTSVTRDKLANRLFKMNAFTRTGNNPILRRTLRAMKYQFKRKLIFDMTGQISSKILILCSGSDIKI